MKVYNRFESAKKNAGRGAAFAPNVYPPTGIKLKSKAKILYTDELGMLCCWANAPHRTEYYFQWNTQVSRWVVDNLSAPPEFDCYGTGAIYCKTVEDRTLFQIRFPEHEYMVYSMDRIGIVHRCLKWVRDHL